MIYLMEISEMSTKVTAGTQDEIYEKLKSLCARSGIRLVLTTGGTGPGPRDVTPEATRRVIEKELKLVRVIGVAVLGDPGPPNCKQMKAKQIHYTHRGSSRTEQIRPHVQACRDQRSPV